MDRWRKVPDQTIEGLTVKMYREPFEAAETQKVPAEGLDLDHYAYKYLGSELDMYKILDTNFVEFMEERGDVSRMKNILIPTKEKTGFSII